MTSMFATNINIVRPVYALTALLSHLNTESTQVAQQLMRIGINAYNTRTTRSVFTAPFNEESGECSFADSDIGLSFFLHLAKNRKLLREVFEENPKPIVDRNVITISKMEFHVAFTIDDQRAPKLLLIPRLDPKQLEHYQFVRVYAVC
jgi:hypothetical protein